MLTGISWGQFLSFWTVLLILYYAAVAVIFYKTDIFYLLKNGFGKRKALGAASIHESNGLLEKNNVQEVSTEKPTNQSAVHDLLEELKIVFARALAKSYQKEELLMALQLLFKKYQSIKNTPFQSAVNNQIIRECLDSCSIELESNDLINCW